MFNLEWLRARGVSRGEPGLSVGRGRRLAVLGLLLAGSLLQTGCQSGPFSPCGFFGRTTSRIMRPFRHGQPAPCATDCVSDAGCVSSGVAVESMVPGTVVMPGATMAPGAIPSNQLSSPVEAPSNLEALPKSDIGPPPGTTRRTPSASGAKTSFETQRPDYRASRARGENLAHTLISTPVPAARPARDASAPRTAQSASSSEGDDTLDHLPPLDLPAEVTEKGTTPPVAPAAERAVKPTTNPAKVSDRPVDRSASQDPLSLTGAARSAPDPAPQVGGAPGIARFAAVDLKLAGGSLPSTEGLDWLEEKGYRTLVDLRDASETDGTFIAEATRRGFRYIALPIGVKAIDRDHLARFNFELALSDARPLYFFDRDGQRAGTLWYLRRITVDRTDTQVARREAEELGLSDPAYWSAAASFQTQAEGPTPAATGRAGAATPGAQSSRSVPTLELPRPESPARRPTTQALGEFDSEAPSSASLLPTAAPAISWAVSAASSSGPRPLMTMIVMGLAFPLAFLGRDAAPTILALTRASLPATARLPRSDLPASDA